MIKFDAKKHKYYDENGPYESVTTLLGKLFPFDKNAIAKAIIANPNSNYYKWTIKEVFKDWAKSSKEGNRVHNGCEKYLKNGSMPLEEDVLACVKQFAKLRFKGKILSEERVWSTKYRLAGTVDILEELKDIIYLYDLKTYKQITNDRIHKLSLQLEIYRRLVEERYNKPCKVIGGLVFEDFVRQRENTKMIFCKCLDTKEEVDKILENRLKEIE